MADLKTKYMGLELRSPIIAGSCGLTSDVEKMVEMSGSRGVEINFRGTD